MMKTIKLTKAQQQLLDAMRNGVACVYMPYMGRFNETAYYFRNDTMKRCTVQAKALLDMGLVEKQKEDWRTHRLVYKNTTHTR